MPRLIAIAAIALVLALPLAPRAARAQEPVLRFERLSIEQGLVHSTVGAFAQGYRGFVWIGTNDGLQRYDGYGFRTYRYSPADPASLSSNAVTSLLSDSREQLWVGTRSGLNRLDPASGRITRFLHDPADPASLSDNWVGTLAEDDQGRIWVGTRFGGVNRYDPASDSFMALSSGPDAVGGLVVRDREGRIWLGNSAGLQLIDTAGGRLIPYAFDPSDPQRDVYALAQDRDGNLWIGSDNGLFVYSLADGLRAHYRHDPADPRSLSSDTTSFVFIDRRDRVWVGTYDAGLNRFDQARGDFRRIRHDPANPNSLSTDSLLSMFEDRTGLLWIGTDRGGISSFNSETEELHHYTYDSTQPANLSGNQISTLYESRDRALWVGTFGDGLNRFDRAARDLTVYRAGDGPGDLSAGVINAIFEDREGLIWAGTYGGGLNRIDPATGRVARFLHDPADPASISSDYVGRVLEGRDGTLWVATEGGLNILDRASGRFRRIAADPGRPDALAHPDVSALYEGADGTLWVGTWGGGLHRMLPGGAGFARYPADLEDPAALSDGFIYQITGDAQGRLWIGTLNGLNMLDPATGRFTRYDESDGLPSNNIMCALPVADGSLWLSTGRGLARLDPASGAVRVLTPRDGLQAYEYSGGACHQSAGGELFFGGINGLNAFFPNDLTPFARGPVVALTDVRLFNRPMALDQDVNKVDRLDLAHGDSVISFEFAALDYTNPAANRFAYKLEGFDADWVDAGTQRSATYTNLDPGEYTFRVRAANPSGFWSEGEAEIRLLVRPPPWRTWWAYLLYAAGAAGLVGGYIQWRVRSAEGRRRELERLVARRTAELERANQALAVRTAEFHNLFEQAPVGIAVVRDGVVRNVNPAVLRMFGYDRPEEMSGSLVLEHLAPGERVAEIERVMRQARGEPAAAAREVTMLRRDGTPMPIFTHAALNTSFEGEPAAISFVVDLSALKAAEQERDRFFNLARDLLCIAGQDGYFKRLNPAWETTLGLTREELQAEPFLSFVHPDDRAATQAATRAADGQLLTFENRYRAKDGSYRWLAWSYAWAPEQQLYYGVARDISEQKRAAAEQRRLYQVADGLREVISEINSDRPLPELLEFIIAQATRLLNVEAGVVMNVHQLQPDGQIAAMRCEASYGLRHDLRGVILPPEASVFSVQALRTRAPAVNTQLQRYVAGLDELGPTIDAREQRFLQETSERFRSLVAVPLFVADEAYGTLVVYGSSERQFSAEELRLATAFASQSALAIQTARLREQARQAAVGEERNRLARELHDAITQSLYSLTLLAEGCRFQAQAAGQAQAAEDFRRMGEIAQQALREMRLLIYQLRPPVLQTEGLAGAIRQRLDLVEQRAGLRARLIVEDEVELAPEAEEQIYRIVQEALNNTLKHAGAREVAVRLRRVERDGAPQAEVQVSDDGRGFTPGEGGGIGLSSMRERAAALGGSLRIESGPETGTIVTILAPAL